MSNPLLNLSGVLLDPDYELGHFDFWPYYHESYPSFTLEELLREDEKDSRARVYASSSQALFPLAPQLPKTDIVDKGDYIIICFDVHGYEIEDISIEFDKEKLDLTISGKAPKLEKVYLRKESYHPSFTRVISLGDYEINPSDVREGSFMDDESGCIILVFPKTPKKEAENPVVKIK